MKTVAFFVPNLHSGGSERMAARLSKVLEKKYRVLTVLFDDSNISYDYGGQLVHMSVPASPSKLGKVITFLKRLWVFRRLVKKEKIDICFSFTSAADYVNAFSKADCVRVVSCRGAAFLERHLKLYRKMCKNSHGILFNSEEMRDIYLQEYPEDAGKAFVLYNLFDTESISLKAQEELSSEVGKFFEEHKVVTTVSRFSAEKGHWHLIKAFELLKEKIPDSGLVMVGHMGAFEQNIRKMAESSPHYNDMLFVGYSDNPFKYVSRSAVYALSSVKEGFPNSLVEAMALGTPVVSTDCKTGPGEILFNKTEKVSGGWKVADYGVITPPFEDEADFDVTNKQPCHKIYAEALEKVIKDKTLAKKLAEKGVERATEFDVNKSIEKYIELIELLIETNSRRRKNG